MNMHLGLLVVSKLKVSWPSFSDKAGLTLIQIFLLKAQKQRYVYF